MIIFSTKPSFWLCLVVISQIFQLISASGQNQNQETQIESETKVGETISTEPDITSNEIEDKELEVSEKPNKILENAQDVVSKGITQFVKQFRGKLAHYLQRRMKEGRVFTGWLGGTPGPTGATGWGGWPSTAPATQGWTGWLVMPMMAMTGLMYILDLLTKWFWPTTAGPEATIEFSSPGPAGGWAGRSSRSKNNMKKGYLSPIIQTSYLEPKEPLKPSRLLQNTWSAKDENNPFPYPDLIQKKIINVNEKPFKLD